MTLLILSKCRLWVLGHKLIPPGLDELCFLWVGWILSSPQKDSRFASGGHSTNQHSPQNLSFSVINPNLNTSRVSEPDCFQNQHCNSHLLRKSTSCFFLPGLLKNDELSKCQFDYHSLFYKWFCNFLQLILWYCLCLFH